MLTRGLVSITFRSLTPGEIIDLCVKAGVKYIEWGGDVHVPHGDTATASAVKAECEAKGINCPSYGSYYRCGEGQDFAPVLKCAEILGVSTIRVWAGVKGSEAVTADERKAIIDDLAAICAAAEKAGMTISLEYHQNTLTDTPESAVKLCGEVGSDALRLYWQPNQNRSFEENTRGLNLVLPYLTNVHVFAWEGKNRYPLADQAAYWRDWIMPIRRLSGTHALLMEFVPEDKPENFLRDAEVLDELIGDDSLALIRRFGYNIPYTDDTSVLATPLPIGDSGVSLRSRITLHPMEGFDSETDGSPSELTLRRYDRFAGGGSALVWIEATSVTRDGRTSPRQLWLHEGNADSYARLAENIHRESKGAKVILQLTHSGRFSSPDGKPAPVIAYHNPVLNQRLSIDPDYPTVTDEYLDRLGDTFVAAAKLARDAGYDGVDIKCCHRYLFSELLAAYDRPGRYGGSYENRTRILLETIRRVRDEVSPGKGFIIASRFGLADMLGSKWGFGGDPSDENGYDLGETLRLLRDMEAAGVRLIDMTMGTPYYNPHINRPYSRGGYLPPEHPLAGVERMITAAAEAQRAVPGIAFIGTGYSYLGEYAAGAAAAAINAGMVSAYGVGRMAFAYPDYPRDVLEGRYDPKKACITCGKCTEIMRAGGTTGCPVRDPKIYAPIYRDKCMNR